MEAYNQLNQEICNVDAEQSLLGAIILNNNYLITVQDILKPEHFHYTTHQKIYSHIIYCVEKNNIVADRITLKQLFETDLDIKNDGGVKYLSVLLSGASSFGIRDYADIIIDCWKRRELKNYIQKILEKISIPSNSFHDLSSELSQKIENLDIDEQTQPRPIANVVAEKLWDMANKKNDEIVSTGFIGLDDKTGGFNKGYLVIIAGRPSMGKTTFSLCLAKEIAKNDHVLYISIEMTSKQIISKIIGNEASINLKKIKLNDLNKSELETACNAGERIGELKFNIDYPTKGITIRSLKAKIKRQVEKFKTKVVFIDHLGKIKSEGKTWSKNEEVSQITNSLKDIANELGIVIVVLSQLSRAVEQRQDKRPQLSDLRDSGSIEQDADIVMFCFRAEYYLERCMPSKVYEPNDYAEWERELSKVRGLCEIIIAKAREGEPQTARFNFNGSYGRFTEIQEANDSY
jgi:replicative DNA helicase